MVRICGLPSLVPWYVRDDGAGRDGNVVGSVLGCLVVKLVAEVTACGSSSMGM